MAKTPVVSFAEMQPRKPGWYFVQYDASGDIGHVIVEWPAQGSAWDCVTDWQELPGLSWPLRGEHGTL